MNILVLNGPNLNMLGIRDKTHYGKVTLDEITSLLKAIAHEHGTTLHFFQSNHEGVLIDYIQKHRKNLDGILINPGALTHYGYSLRDALADTRLPVVEVHLSSILEREEFRKTDVLEGITIARIMGLKEKSYTEGLEKLIGHIKKNE